jgi:hypothetical protein
VSRPAKIPDATQGDRKSEHGWQNGEAPPAALPFHLCRETQPSRQKPEPQSKETCPDHKGSESGYP